MPENMDETAAQEPKPAPAPRPLRVKPKSAPFVNVREAPSERARVIGRMRGGEQIQGPAPVVDGWRRVGEGYVRADLVG